MKKVWRQMNTNTGIVPSKQTSEGREVVHYVQAVPVQSPRDAVTVYPTVKVPPPAPLPPSPELERQRTDANSTENAGVALIASTTSAAGVALGLTIATGGLAAPLLLLAGAAAVVAAPHGVEMCKEGAALKEKVADREAARQQAHFDREQARAEEYRVAMHQVHLAELAVRKARSLSEIEAIQAIQAQALDEKRRLLAPPKKVPLSGPLTLDQKVARLQGQYKKELARIKAARHNEETTRRLKARADRIYKEELNKFYMQGDDK